ncbi:phosphopantetheine-binding protein [Lichenicoccus sp.]|uniref:phosphopantetheine-binding protein n=1 Tax=Lichenicoccus sp. TaxID=2781899 RepID=UPI003D12C542
MTEALNQTIITAVISAIRRTLFLPDSPIGLETRFAEDLSLDSLDIVELTMSLEETFKTEFPPEANSRFRSVSDLVTYLSRRYFQDDRESLSAA